MSDTTETVPPPPETPPEAPVEAAPEGVVPPPAEAPPETFDRDYVEKLRSEAAGRRTAIKPYEEAFKGFDDEARTTYLELAAQIASGDAKQQKAAAVRFREIAERIDGATVPVTPTGDVDPDLQPMTRKELRELQEADKQESLIQAAIKDIEAEATAAGITPGSERYASYLHALQRPEVAGDHDKALAILAVDRQAIIDEYAASVAAGAEKWPSAPGSSGAGAPSSEVVPRGWKDARKAAMAMAEGQPGKATG